ncbi:MAG: outer membrane protein assembly factor BamC [Gammaproteobacteria bacterium]
MMKFSRGLPLFAALLAVQLPACSTIKGMFPDKEKDYQYTTEIPSLIVPSELTDNPAFEKADVVSAESDPIGSDVEGKDDEALAAQRPSADDAGRPVEPSKYVGGARDSEPRPSGSDESEFETQTAETVPVEQEFKNEAAPSGTDRVDEYPTSEEEQDDRDDKISADLIVYDDGETRLRIGAVKATAWRMVGKALSRNSIEVIERNQEESSYHVHYNPDEQEFEDESIWDEIKFIFSGFESNDKEYVLKLIENNRQTDVAIINKSARPAMNRAGLRLLKLIQKTINTDQAG